MVSVPEVCGAGWWAMLEGVVNAIPCPNCRTHGQSLLSAMHDLRNHEDGKPFHNAKNFERVARDYLQALNDLLKKQGKGPKQIPLPVGQRGPRIDRDPPSLYTREKAQKVIDELSAGDPDWDYRLDCDPNPQGKGLCRVAIYDEDGEFVDYHSQGYQARQPVGDIIAQLGQAKVTITGKCDDDDVCTIRIKATDEVKTTVASPEGIGPAIEEVRRQLEERTRSVGTPLTFAIGANGVTRYEFRYRVVGLSQVIASHDPFTFEINPEFPQEIQPRMRDRAATRLQVQKIAENLEPASLLTDFRTLDRGAPIVGPDLVVESGNGRTMALKYAAAEFPQQYADYVKTLHDVAASFGITAQNIDQVNKADAPVLVRERLTKVDRKSFAEEANTSAAIGSSTIEVARTDADKITLAMLSGLVVGDDQSIEDALRSTGNRSFVVSFLNALPDTDQGKLVDAHGRVNQDGIRRMSAAVFVSAFGSTGAGLRLSEIAFESIDLEVRNVINGIARSLGRLASAEGLVRDGQREADLSIGEDLAQAASVFARIKATPGMTVEKYVNQSQMFERELSDFEEEILTTINGRSRSAKKIAGVIRAYADGVLNSPPPNQGSFIEGLGSSKEELWELAKEKGDQSSDGPRLFQCDPAQARKVERCIQQLKDDPTVNPYAVCQDSQTCALPTSRRTEYGHKLERRPDLEQMIWDLTHQRQETLNQTVIRIIPSPKRS